MANFMADSLKFTFVQVLKQRSTNGLFVFNQQILELLQILLARINGCVQTGFKTFSEDLDTLKQVA